MPYLQNIIYCLRDPRTDEVRYVGKSTSGIKRAASHLVHSHNLRVQEWIHELRAENYEPEIDVLEECEDWQILLVKEKFWIEHFLESGCKLLNDIYSGRINEKNIAFTKIEEALQKKIDEYEKRIIEFHEKLDSFNTLSKFISIHRKEKGFTQKDLAELTGISERTIRMMETDIGSTSLKTVLKCLDIIGFTLKPVIKSMNEKRDSKI